MSVNWIQNNIQGALSQQEAEYLFALAMACTGRGVIVEIGSLLGYSTCFLALGSKYGSKTKVYAVDPFDGGDSKPKSALFKSVCAKGDYYPLFQRNICEARLNEFIVPIIKKSEDAVDDVKWPIELLFIDGSHRYENVLADFKLYSPKVVAGGLIVFHDRGGDGVKKVIDECVGNSPFYECWVFESLLCATRI